VVRSKRGRTGGGRDTDDGDVSGFHGDRSSYMIM
jgi:hypothetical protein